MYCVISSIWVWVCPGHLYRKLLIPTKKHQRSGLHACYSFLKLCNPPAGLHHSRHFCWCTGGYTLPQALGRGARYRCWPNSQFQNSPFSHLSYQQGNFYWPQVGRSLTEPTARATHPNPNQAQEASPTQSTKRCDCEGWLVKRWSSETTMLTAAHIPFYLLEAAKRSKQKVFLNCISSCKTKEWHHEIARCEFSHHSVCDGRPPLPLQYQVLAH